MTCPICDQKPANCDCTPNERRMHSEIEDLESRWIPSSERLPEDGTVVLAWRGKRVVFGYLRGRQWIDTIYGWVIPDGPTHWMPLPEPPT
jgi:hypothetical protein